MQTVAAPLTLSGSELGLRSLGCPAGGMWKWSGTAWVCHPDIDTNSGGDIHGVIAGAGLSGGGTSGSVTLSLAQTPITQDADGYARLPITVGSPPAADCDSAVEAGRLKFAAETDTLYVCNGTSWGAFAAS